MKLKKKTQKKHALPESFTGFAQSTPLFTKNTTIETLHESNLQEFFARSF